jgi:hypothetical protein
MGHATTYKLPSPLSSSNASEDEEIDPEENGGGEVVMKFVGDQKAVEEEVSFVSDVVLDHKLVLNEEAAKDVSWKADKKTAPNVEREAEEPEVENEVEKELYDETDGEEGDDANDVVSWKAYKKIVGDAVRVQLNDKTPRGDLGGHAVYRRELRLTVQEAMIICARIFSLGDAVSKWETKWADCMTEKWSSTSQLLQESTWTNIFYIGQVHTLVKYCWSSVSRSFDFVT